MHRHTNIMCSISGGSDSDIMIDVLSKYDVDIKYVYFDTGSEYNASKKHLDYLEQEYNINILRVPVKKSVPLSCKQYGVPFLSKYISEMIQRLQKYDFKWQDKPYDALIAEYPKCQSALKWWCNANGSKSRYNIDANKYLKEFLMDNPPQFAISNKCCRYAKKTAIR